MAHMTLPICLKISFPRLFHASNAGCEKILPTLANELINDIMYIIYYIYIYHFYVIFDNEKWAKRFSVRPRACLRAFCCT